LLGSEDGKKKDIKRNTTRRKEKERERGLQGMKRKSGGYRLGNAANDKRAR